MRKIARGFLLVSVPLVIAGTAAEILLRLFHPQPTYGSLKLPYDFHCFSKSQYYFIALEENADCLLKSNEGAFPPTFIKTNSLGLRNPEIRPKTEDKKRILFVGDSYTLGWGVDEDRAFPRLVEKNLSGESDKGAESINAGMAGAGPGYYYLFLKNEGSKMKPDIVVAGLFMANDIPFSNQLSQWRELDRDGLPAKITAGEFSDLRGNLYFARSPLIYRFPLLRNLHLFSFLEDKLKLSRFEGENRQIALMTCLYKSSCKDLEEAKEKVKKLILGMKKLTGERGAELLVVLIPMELELSGLPSIFYWGVPLLPKDLDYPYREFTRFFRDNRIDYLDMRDDFRKKEAEGLYYKDGHFSPAGHKLAAEVIGRKLKEYLND